MKRTLLTIGAGLGLILALLIGLVNVLAARRTETPRPEPSQLVLLPDGSERSIAELIAPWAEPQSGEQPGAAQLGQLAAADSDGSPREEAQRAPPLTPEQIELHIDTILEQLRQRRLRPPTGDDPFELAEWHRHKGRLDQAEALYLSMPENHPKWARSQRRLAWDVYAKSGEAGRGVPFVHESIRADPLDGNAWQDAARVYAATLGFPVD